MEITKGMLDKFLEAYNDLDRAYDRYDDKLAKYISEDASEDRIRRLEARMDKISAKMDGMVDALNIFGYTVKWQDHGNGNRQWVIVLNS